MYNRIMLVEPLAELPERSPAVLGPHVAADYFALPNEPRCELLAGELVVTPAPTSRHQRVLTAMLGQLLRHARAHGGAAIPAPVDVVLDEHTVVQPDLCWVSLARRYRVGDRIQGAPDLMVEILSPASERRDRVWKLTLYARSDVREVWLADPDSRSFEAFENRSGDLFPLRPDPNRYASSVLPHLVLDLDELWADSERWDPKAD